jgi:hypothetical protein
MSGQNYLLADISQVLLMLSHRLGDIFANLLNRKRHVVKADKKTNCIHRV